MTPGSTVQRRTQSQAGTLVPRPLRPWEATTAQQTWVARPLQPRKGPASAGQSSSRCCRWDPPVLVLSCIISRQKKSGS